MRSRSVPTSAPAFLTVSLAEVKNYLRVDDTNDDALITALINVAVLNAESYIDRKIVSREYDVSFDNFPKGTMTPINDPDYNPAMDALINGGAGPLKMPFGNLQSIDEFNTYADDGVAVLFPSSNYNVDLNEGRIALKQSGVWPMTVLRFVDGIVVSLTAGYVDAASVPDDIKQALYLMIAKLYENRGDDKDTDTGFTLPYTAMVLLEPYRRHKVGGF